jgi:hypothetical protein
MGPVLIIALIIAMGAVVFAVIRGLHAFANLEPENVDENGVPKSLAVQNKAMYSRVKWQAIAIIIVIVLLMIANAK